MLDTTLPPDLPAFSDTAAAAIRRQQAARLLCDSVLERTGRIEAGRLRHSQRPSYRQNSYRAVQI